MAFRFSTPSVEEGPAGGGPLFGRYRLARGVTVLVKNGVTSEVRYPSQEQLDAADQSYLGGHVHLVSQAERDVLVSNGYAVTEV